MIESLFLIGLGMVIGWNVLPQPAWVKTLYGKVANWWTNPE